MIGRSKAIDPYSTPRIIYVARLKLLFETRKNTSDGKTKSYANTDRKETPRGVGGGGCSKPRIYVVYTFPMHTYVPVWCNSQATKREILSRQKQLSR